MSNITFLDLGSFKKPVNVYLITNCVDDAYVYAAKSRALQKMKELPNYTVFEWPKLRYHEIYDAKFEVVWQRPRKRVNGVLEFDDTRTPWEMLLLAKRKDQWYTNRRFESIKWAMEKFADRKYHKICGYDVPIEEETNCESIWFSGFAGAEITDRNWLTEYKNKLHPNDEWTDVNLETYVKWIGAIDYDERRKVIDAALGAHVVGYLD